MASASSFIAHTLDCLVEPRYCNQDSAYERAFASLAEDTRSGARDYVRGFRRSTTHALDWAGDKLLVATKENKLILYDVERAEEDRSWQGEWMSVQCSPRDPHIAAAVSWSGKFRVFDTRTAQQAIFDADLKKVGSSMKEFLYLCWSPDAKHIAVNNRADQVYLLNLTQPGSLTLGASKNMPHEVNQMVWSGEGDALWIATGGVPGKIHVFPTPSLSHESAAAVVAHQSPTIALAADQAGKYIASGGGDYLVTLWDPQHLVCVRTFGYAAQPVTTVGFNKNGTLLAWGTGSGSAGGEKNLTFVGADTGTLYWQETTSAPVQQLKWHPNRNVIAYALNVAQLPDDRDARVRDRGDLAVLRTLKIPEAL
eukprot:TRINITY_DN49023_c0_g1_i1.p1 TRINITY_DN49023_c0_g1~~TRINITY_DN49023_c0_g1_i1.p1  ORF type:complete len:389 (+),score=51.74 TRINITY_DN49023_c0_g1_i1:67-1167(+)